MLLLGAQVRVVALVTRCAVTDGADLSGLLEEQLLAAAHVRCRMLLATVGAPPVSAPQPCCLIRLRTARVFMQPVQVTLASQCCRSKPIVSCTVTERRLHTPGGHCLSSGSPTSPTAARSLCGLATAVEQLAQDITDDAESYQAALPAACGLSLAAIAARHACDLAWRALHLCARL